MTTEQLQLEADDTPDEKERWRVLSQLEEWIETPMVVLSFIWLSLVVVELIWTTSGVFQLLGTIIWIIFIAEFFLRFVLAPRKLRFLRRNPITIIALLRRPSASSGHCGSSGWPGACAWCASSARPTAASPPCATASAAGDSATSS
jgi:hypothetical protein